MIGAWFARLWAKVAGYAAAAGALVLGVLAVLAIAWRKGAKHQASVDDAANADARVQAAIASQHAAQARTEVENETARLPDAPAQQLGTADPSTAAGQLRTDGWLRDDNGTGGDQG